MSKTRYLITGGAGFIGSNLTAALVSLGERVRVVDNLATGRWENLDGIEKQSMVERIDGDIRDAEVMRKACAGVEVVFHQGALGSVPRSVDAPTVSDAVNVGGTVNVLDCARREGVRRVLFAASSSAYGETPVLPKHEGLEATPLSPYAVSKLACEHYMRVFARLYGIETLSLRYFNVFGPNQTPDGAYAAAIPRFVDAALQNRPIPIHGDGLQTRDFCFVENTVLANLLGATSPRKFSGEVVNIAGGRRIGLNELCHEIGNVIGKKPEIQYGPPRAGDVRDSLADISRASELLGYSPRVRWEDGLVPTVAFLRTLRDRGPSEAAKTLTTLRFKMNP